jgi:hypothetical protein
MSCDWRRLRRVRGVSSRSPENHWVPWLIHKAKTEEPKTEVQQHQTGLTSGYVRRSNLETSKRRTRVAQGLRRGEASLRSLGIRPMER